MRPDDKAPSPFDLRVFATLLCPFCAFIAVWIKQWIGVERLWLWVALCVLPVSVIGVIRPAAISGVYRQWIRVTAPIGRAISILLLSAIYFLVIAPMGLCLRVCGVDPAQRRWNSRLQTYWIDRSRRSDDNYFHPF